MKHLKTFESFSVNESKGEDFLKNYVDENDLGDEMFELQNDACDVPSTLKGAAVLYPKFMLELEVFFEDAPEQKEFLEKNKDKVLSGLLAYIKYCKADL